MIFSRETSQRNEKMDVLSCMERWREVRESKKREESGSGNGKNERKLIKG